MQFKQKIGPQHQPQLHAPDDDDDDDDDDDEDDTSVPSSTPETAPPPPPPTASSSSTTAAAAVPSTSGVSKSSKKKGCTPGDPDIVQLLLQHQERSQAAGKLCQLVIQTAGPTNNKSAWGLFLHSNLLHVHDRVWPVYLKMEMENYIWALNESDNIRERQQRQQQQPVHQVQNPPPVQLPQSHQF